MKRRLLNLATVCSLLLCACVYYLWFRNYRDEETIGLARVVDRSGQSREPLTPTLWFAEARFWKGRVAVEFSRYQFDASAAGGPKYLDWFGHRSSPPFGYVDGAFWHLLWDFDADRVTYRGSVYQERVFPPRNAVIIHFPAWVAVAVFSILPLMRFSKWRRRQRRRIGGLCVSCGYDLRESPERCPECGRVP